MVESLTDLILSRVLIFYSVYDGHGGSQVSIYCRERMHLALTEEKVKEKPEFCDGDTWHRNRRELRSALLSELTRRALSPLFIRHIFSTLIAVAREMFCATNLWINIYG